MRRFELFREEDESGVSGTGIVAVGVEFPSGRCVMEWCSGVVASQGHYDSVKDLVKVHGHGGKTRVQWVDARARPVHRRVNPPPMEKVYATAPKKRAKRAR